MKCSSKLLPVKKVDLSLSQTTKIDYKHMIEKHPDLLTYAVIFAGFIYRCNTPYTSGTRLQIRIQFVIFFTMTSELHSFLCAYLFATTFIVLVTWMHWKKDFVKIPMERWQLEPNKSSCFRISISSWDSWYDDMFWIVWSALKGNLWLRVRVRNF